MFTPNVTLSFQTYMTFFIPLNRKEFLKVMLDTIFHVMHNQAKWHKSILKVVHMTLVLYFKSYYAVLCSILVSTQWKHSSQLVRKVLMSDLWMNHSFEFDSFHWFFEPVHKSRQNDSFTNWSDPGLEFNLLAQQSCSGIAWLGIYCSTWFI